MVLLLVWLWQSPFIWLAVAVANAEQRPALLFDAGWDDAASAKMFQLRFHAGMPESQLLAWLEASKFSVDRVARQAKHLIQGLPCNERATIDWSADANGNLRDATAVVSEAGCL